MKKLLAILLALFVVLGCFVSCGNNSADDDTSTTVADDGKLRVPDDPEKSYESNSYKEFSAIDLAGQKYDQSIWEGKKLTMVNIWATFCRPCINEMPDLEALSKEYEEDDFQIIGIISDVDYDSEYCYDTALMNKALDVIEMTGVTYINLLPSFSLIDIKLENVYSVPETIFVDENGNQVGESYIGSRSFESWKAIVDELLASM